jgi:hypothetical protein
MLADQNNSVIFNGRNAAMLVMALLMSFLSGCAATLLERNPVPDGLAQERAVIPGLPGIRFWADEVPIDPVTAFKAAVPDLPQLAASAERLRGRPVVDILALSGGGGDGAFGAGVLVGWSQLGTRPHFEVVTGVSAGAIIAPFAFLGPKYDAKLREVWTRFGTKDIGKKQGLAGIVGGDALIETSGLATLIARYLDDAMIDEIGREYLKGRVLMVLTTNLDAQRPVVWNLGALALKRNANTRRLFHKIILASAAIPAVFSPVKIPVVVDGKTYDELHVDGGTTQEIFISPARVPLKSLDGLYDKPPIRRIYLIKNGRGKPVYQAVEQKTLAIAGRAISTLILNQSSGEVYQIYRRALDAKAEFNFIAIPAEFPFIPSEVFDPVYQTKLFDYGVELGRAGKSWLNMPPELIAGTKQSATVKLRTVERPKAVISSPGFSVEDVLAGGTN